MSDQDSPEIQAGPDSAQDIDEQVISGTASINPLGKPTIGVQNGNIKPSTDGDVSEKPSTASPNLKKRAFAETTQVEASNQSKKPRESPSPSSPPADEPGPPRFPSPLDHHATTLDKETWLGFCDIESEPAYFSVILREMGVQGVTVREVFGMDPDTLAMLPQPIYGLILLYGYREFGKADPAATCPTNMWFANQLPAHNSCATLAMINILMNSPDVQVGEHLDQFKDFTRSFSPYQRGEALASFDFVRKIHNSFAKKMDILEADKNLSYKVHKAAREPPEYIEDKKKKSPAKKNSSGSGGGTARTRARAASTDTVASDDSAKLFEERAHHYIAFIPSDTEAWKLDGLDAAPTYIDTCNIDAAETWLDPASKAITALMDDDTNSDHKNDFAIFALTQSPLVSLRTRARTAFHQLHSVEAQLSIVAPTWRDTLTPNDTEPPSPTLLGIAEESTTSNSTGDPPPPLPTLLAQRTSTIRTLTTLAASIMAEVQSEADEELKARQRRFDAGPVIKTWLEMLAGNGHLEENLGRFMGK